MKTRRAEDVAPDYWRCAARDSTPVQALQLTHQGQASCLCHRGMILSRDPVFAKCEKTRSLTSKIGFYFLYVL